MRCMADWVTAAVLRLVLLVCVVSCVQSQKCGTSYSTNGGTPLLFGGVKDRCTEGCRPRTGDRWSKRCSFRSEDYPSTCTAAQAKRNFDLIKPLGQGRILDLSPCDILPFLRRRTLWIIGDSHSKSYFLALQCFLFDFWDHNICQPSTDSAAVDELLKLPLRDGNTNCIHLRGPGGGRICMVEAVLGSSLINNPEVAEGGVLPLLRSKFAQPQDIFSVQFGAWHKKTGANWDKYLPTLKALGQYYEATKAEWPHLFFSETPASHPPGRNSKTCQAARGYVYDISTGMLNTLPQARTMARENAWSSGAIVSTVAMQVIPRFRMPYIPLFNISVPLHDNHPGTRKMTNGVPDCIHFCQPGIPEVWVWRFYEVLKSGEGEVKPLPVKEAPDSSSSGGSSGSSRSRPTTKPPVVVTETAAASKRPSTAPCVAGQPLQSAACTAVTVQQTSFDGQSPQLFFGQTALTAQARFDLSSSSGAATVLITAPAAGREMYAVQIFGKSFDVTAGVTYLVMAEVKASSFAAPFALGLIWDKVWKPAAYQGFKANTYSSLYTLSFTPTGRLLSNQLFATLDFGGAAADTLYTIDSITIKTTQPSQTGSVAVPVAAAPAAAPQLQSSAGTVMLQQSFTPGVQQVVFPRTSLNAKATFDLSSTAGTGTILVTAPAPKREMYAIQLVSKPVSATAGFVYTVSMEVKASVPGAPLGIGLIWDKVAKPARYQEYKATTTSKTYILTFASGGQTASSALVATINFGGAAADTLYTITSIAIQAKPRPGQQQQSEAASSSGGVLVQDAFNSAEPRVFKSFSTTAAKATFSVPTQEGTASVLVVSPTGDRQANAIQLFGPPFIASAGRTYTMTADVKASVGGALFAMSLTQMKVFKPMAYRSFSATKATSTYTLSFTSPANVAPKDLFAIINFGAAAANTLFVIDNITIRSSAAGAAQSSQSGRRLQVAAERLVADAAADMFWTDADLSDDTAASDDDLPAGLVVSPSAGGNDGSMGNGGGTMLSRSSGDTAIVGDAGAGAAVMPDDPDNGVFACVPASLVFKH